MRFGLTRKQSQKYWEDKTDQQNKPKLWFAWYPVRLQDGSWLWFELTITKRVYEGEPYYQYVRVYYPEKDYRNRLTPL